MPISPKPSDTGTDDPRVVSLFRDDAALDVQAWVRDLPDLRPTRHAEIASLERPSLIDRVIDALSEDRWQFRVTVFCYVVATLAGCYFAWQLGRGAL